MRRTNWLPPAPPAAHAGVDRRRGADAKRTPGSPDGRPGVANKEIAHALFVTVKAVEAHLSSVYRKLQIKSRTQLADVISGLR